MSRPRLTSEAVVCTRLAEGGIERITAIGPGRYLREVMTDDERVVESRPVTKHEAEQAAGHPLAAVAPHAPRLSVERVLLRLLWEHAGEVVTHRHVADAIERPVAPSTVRDAAHRLRRSLPVEAVRGPGGGYRLPVVAKPREATSTLVVEEPRHRTGGSGRGHHPGRG